MTPSGIESVTYWLVAQCLKQLRHQQRAHFIYTPQYTTYWSLRDNKKSRFNYENHGVVYSPVPVPLTNWRKTKKKETQGVRVVPVLWHEMSAKNTGPSYIGR
jgi:hypothetical protein